MLEPKREENLRISNVVLAVLDIFSTIKRKNHEYMGLEGLHCKCDNTLMEPHLDVQCFPSSTLHKNLL